MDKKYFPCLKNTKWACTIDENKPKIFPYMIVDNKNIVLLPDFRVIDLQGMTDEQFFKNNIMFENVRILDGRQAFDYIIKSSKFGELPEAWKYYVVHGVKFYEFVAGSEENLIRQPIEDEEQLELFVKKIKNSYIKEIQHNTKMKALNKKIRDAKKEYKRLHGHEYRESEEDLLSK